METNCVLTMKGFFQNKAVWNSPSNSLRNSIILGILVLSFPFCLSAQNLQDPSHDSEDLVHQSEDFWASIDFVKFKRELGQSLKISGSDLNLFYLYLEPYIHEDRVDFFSNAPFGGIPVSDFSSYIASMKQKYIALYPEFVKVKDAFAMEREALDNKPLEINGPCTNIGFENGNLNGWKLETGTACGSANCSFNTISGPNCRITTTNASMIDPWIPGLSTVAPGGGNNSVRIGDFQNGFGLSRISQTFMVTPANNVFTYKYAVVLEDPSNNHTDDQRPYFEVMMYDGAGNEIQCATYTRIASSSYLADYINRPITNPYNPVNNDPLQRNGCPYGGRGNANNSPDATRNLWYKDWTTVSIPLLNYVGQNVTIVFTASDCSRGAHLGYAYVDAECSSMTPLNPVTICGTQNVTFSATPGFQNYRWVGPGIVGSNSNRAVTVNRSGSYTVTLTPFTDNPVGCPTTQTIDLLEHCPRSITVPFCEGVKGSGTVTGINLATYNTQILNYNLGSPKTLVSWHRALPPNNTNIVATPSNLTVTNGMRFYALINYNNNFGKDTAVLNFVIHPKPNVVIPAIPTACVGSAPFQITGATPAGGTFSGANVTAGGVFNPSAVGTFTIQYKYISPQGCPDSNTQVVTVRPRPTVVASPDQTICVNATTINLSGTITNSTGSQWVGGAGSFVSGRNALNVTYTPTVAEKASGSFTLTLSTTGNSPCAEVTDPVVITVRPLPVVDAGPPRTICSDNPVATLNGSVTNAPGVIWSGGTGFAPNNNVNTVYTASAANISAGSVTLTITTTGSTVCPEVSDRTTVTIIPPPTVNAGPDETYCENVTSVLLSGTTTNASSRTWSGGSGFFSSTTSLNPTYTPTSAEKNSGSVTLRLVANPNSPCSPVQDFVTINFTQTSTIYAGPDQKLCSSPGLTFTMNASSSNGGTWSGGGGTFSSPTAPNAIYTPSATELANGGTVTLSYTSAAGDCPMVTDNMTITIVLPPTVNAGRDTTHCSTIGAIALGGQATRTNSVQWTLGTGTFILDANRLAPTYIPTIAEKNSGSLTLRLRADGIAPCLPVTDDVVINFIPPPSVNAGTDQTLCALPGVTFTMNGTSSNGGATWTGGSGNFSSSTAGNSVYTPSAGEIASGGNIVLTYTNSGNAPCLPISDKVTLTLVLPPTVDANDDTTFCATIAEIVLNGSASNHNSVFWSGGAGLFSPDANTLGAIYTPTDAEKLSGSLILTLTAIANSPCSNITDNMTLTFIQPPTVNAGPDQVLCASSGLSFNLGASFTNAPAGVWSGGSGVFSDNTDPNSTYTPTAAEQTNGSVILTFTTTGVAYCVDSLDDVKLSISPIPTPDAGPDQVVCEASSLTVSTPDVNETYVWTNLQGTVVGNGASITIIANTDTTLIVTATSSFNCVGTDTMDVEAIPYPVVNLPNGAMCPGQSTTLNGIVSNFSDIQSYNPVYLWKKNGSLIGGNSTSITVNEEGLYSFIVSAGNCTSDDEATVAFHPVPVVNMPESIKFCADVESSIALDAGPGHTTYNWQHSGENTQTVNVGSPGVYYVTVTNQYTCSASDQILLRQVCPPRLFVGNAFSPDGDGVNDLYNVYGVHIGKFHMLIFNRWGEIIFESFERTHYWDGIYREEPMPIGTYAWTIIYEGDTEEYKGPYKLEGSVTVVR